MFFNELTVFILDTTPYKKKESLLFKKDIEAKNHPVSNLTSIFHVNGAPIKFEPPIEKPTAKSKNKRKSNSLREKEFNNYDDKYKALKSTVDILQNQFNEKEKEIQDLRIQLHQKENENFLLKKDISALQIEKLYMQESKNELNEQLKRANDIIDVLLQKKN